MTKYLAIITILLFLCNGAVSQTCEEYDRKLFHSLPDTFPDKINCKDKAGKKQGWWIYYKVLFNPVDKPDELAAGDYVPDYIVGKYKDDHKVGTWTTVFNVHLISEMREDTYQYFTDSATVTVWFAMRGVNEGKKNYSKDSTIIKSSSLKAGSKHPIIIDCDRRLDKCVMTYRGQLLKIFPYEDFELEFERTFALYEIQRQHIDEDLK